MAKDRIEVMEWLRKVVDEGDEDFLREGIRVLSQALMELEVSDLAGAGYRERAAERLTHRNGYRSRLWDTKVGAVELRIPRLREGSYLPSLLDPRRRVDRAMVSVIQEAYVHGVSTRKVDDLVKALGMTGISRSSVSRVCAELDEMVKAFLERPITEEIPYLWLDATFMRVREGSVVVPQAVVVAVGVTKKGQRTILGADAGPSEDGAFWESFLRGLVRRGLKGVNLVVSDAHEGLKGAITAILSGSAWQRCRVHFMRNALSRVPKGAQAMVAAAIRTIFAQPDKRSAHKQLGQVADSLMDRFPDAARCLLEAEEDILSYMAFPAGHRTRLHSTNPLERLHRELKRRTDVVGIFPNKRSLIRLVGAVLVEQNDEWMVTRRYLSMESMEKLNKETEDQPGIELPAAVA